MSFCTQIKYTCKYCRNRMINVMAEIIQQFEHASKNADQDHTNTIQILT